MGKMTREEVEERLEEYAAYKSIKEAHEDEEENLPEIDNDDVANEVADNSQNSVEEKEDSEEEILVEDIPLEDGELQNEIDHPQSHLLIIAIFQNSTYQTLIS